MFMTINFSPMHRFGSTNALLTLEWRRNKISSQCSDMTKQRCILTCRVMGSPACDGVWSRSCNSGRGDLQWICAFNCRLSCPLDTGVELLTLVSRDLHHSQNDQACDDGAAYADEPASEAQTRACMREKLSARAAGDEKAGSLIPVCQERTTPTGVGPAHSVVAGIEFPRNEE
jgi:hypothetical protein